MEKETIDDFRDIIEPYTGYIDPEDLRDLAEEINDFFNNAD